MSEVTESASFSGHETFPFRYSWMKKGVDACAKNATVFASDEGMAELGVGKNMVRSIRHWCLAARLFDELPTKGKSRGLSLTPSDLGRAVFSDKGFDPYLEDPATLWLLHWQIASNYRRATTWFWAFSHLHEVEFTKETLLQFLRSWVDARGIKRVADSSLRRDIDCFIRTYVVSRQTPQLVLEDTLDCPLVELGLIRDVGDSRAFMFNRGPQQELPSPILFYATLAFWNNGSGNTLSLRELAHAPGSPGRIFQIDEDSLVYRFEAIEALTDGAIVYDETAGMKQLYRRREIATFSFIENCYASTVPNG